MVPVPVYYMSDTGDTLYETSVNAARNSETEVKADTDAVPETYELTGEDTVQVAVDENGIATPATVVFTFRAALPTPELGDQETLVPVRCLDEAGLLLNEFSITMTFDFKKSVHYN